MNEESEKEIFKCLIVAKIVIVEPLRWKVGAAVAPLVNVDLSAPAPLSVVAQRLKHETTASDRAGEARRY